ncbi:hypothetical protein V9K67_23965 [Paraflavisolibacter sp. H34]|uniref:hypothetical protein n=1 Tax=Huijunlia imazamoxiresistens TaxID=3127457 RepID=UPI0030182DE2
MKRMIQLCLFSLLWATGCKKSTDGEKTASFKVEVIQRGNYKDYVRELTLAPSMVYQNSGKSATLLIDEDISDTAYTFVSPEPLVHLECSFHYGWTGNYNQSAQVQFKFYRNNTLIDSSLVNLMPVNEGQLISKEWTFKP